MIYLLTLCAKPCDISSTKMTEDEVTLSNMGNKDSILANNSCNRSTNALTLPVDSVNAETKLRPCTCAFVTDLTIVLNSGLESCDEDEDEEDEDAIAKDS